MIRDARLLVVVAAVPLLVLNFMFIPETRAVFPVLIGVLFLAIQLGLLTRTRGVSLAGFLSMVVAGCLWAVVIFAVQQPIMAITGWDSRSAEATVWIAGPTEEVLKLVPLLAVLVFARNRAARFGVVDHILLGAACGLGFGLAENSVRELVRGIPPSLSEVFGGVFGASTHEYSLFTLFPGWQSYMEIEWAGHAVLTAVVAAGIGLVRRYRTVLLWPLPAVLLAWVTLDHMVWNDRVTLADVLPREAEQLHAALGSGQVLRPLLLALILLAVWLDGRALSSVHGQLPPIPHNGRSQGRFPLYAVVTALAEFRFYLRMLWRAPSRIPAAMAFVRARRELGYGLHRAAGAPRRDAPSTRMLWQYGAALHGTSAVVVVCLALLTLFGAATTAAGGGAAFIAGTFDGLANFWNGLQPAQQALLIAGVTAGLMLIPGLGFVSALTWSTAAAGLASSWDDIKEDIKTAARERGIAGALLTLIVTGAAVALGRGRIRFRPRPAQPPRDRQPGTLRDFLNRKQDPENPKKRSDLENLSDEQLLRAANDPYNDPFGLTIDRGNNRISEGNHRVRELMRRADDPNHSITWDDEILINWV